MMDSIDYEPLDSSRVHFDGDTVQRISDLAAALTPISEIATLVDVDEDKLRRAIVDKNSPLRKVYLKAKAETAHRLRVRELELADVGSPLAVQLTHNYLRDMTADEDL